QLRRTNVKRTIICSILTILTFGCTVGPDYKRPKVEVPGSYRTPAPTPATSGTSSRASDASAADPSRGDGPAGSTTEGQAPQSALAPFGDQKWWDVFHDPQLQQLIRTAVQQNY